LIPDFNEDVQCREVPTPDYSFDKVPNDGILHVCMSGGESHIYNETPKDRSHIDKSKHADTPNDDAMPTDKHKHAAMHTVAGMHTDGVKPKSPPKPPPGVSKAADHLVIYAIYACENEPLDELSWKHLVHIATWET
jgi:hypothetical protein